MLKSYQQLLNNFQNISYYMLAVPLLQYADFLSRIFTFNLVVDEEGLPIATGTSNLVILHFLGNFTDGFIAIVKICDFWSLNDHMKHESPGHGKGPFPDQIMLVNARYK